MRALALPALGLMLLASCETPPAPMPEPDPSVVWLDQGWSAADRDLYHHTSQGTEIMPAAWLASLRTGIFGGPRLVDPESLEPFRFITVAASRDPAVNRYGFPVGIAVHTHEGPGEAYRGVRMAGFTCAACHTGQIDHAGRSIIIEGGAAMHDAVAFQRAMGRAMILTAELPWKRGAFLREVLERDPDWPGGRIALEAAFDRAVARIRVAAAAPDTGLNPVPEGHGRLDALQRIANQLLADNLAVPANARPMDAPVSFPPLWDIWRFDWVQYNASVRQPMVRNVGEALGVRARTNFIDAEGRPIAEPARWDSSARVRDIDSIERALHRLTPPPWPEEVLGPIDRPLAARGRALFEQRCARCHAVQLLHGTGEPPEWHVPVLPLDRIGTDRNAAQGFAGRRYDARRLGIAQPITGVEALTVVTEAVKNRAYDKLVPPPTPAERAALDGFGRENLVRAPCGYKARPLIGIWATAPFLHNGSVPTLWDMLSPERPARFVVGDRAFDPVKVGYRTDRPERGTVLDTTMTGNSNQGHWFRDRPGRGVIGPAIAEDDRRALIEYLKSASYADYPVRLIERPREVPCGDTPRWAMR
jgi:mono/diheme cytochrome c family protein